MTLILSGTDGLSDVDGTAATPAIRGTDANTGIFFPAADTIAFSEGGTESMRITSTGSVFVKTADARIGSDVGSVEYGTSTANSVKFFSNNTEAMRIDSSGNLLVGGTDPSGLGIGTQRVNCIGSSGVSPLLANSLSGNNASVALFLSSSTSGYTANIVDIRTGMASGAGFNAISYKSDTSTTRFNVSGNGNVTNTNNSYGSISDVKLKENITDATPKLADLMQVRVRNYNLKSDPSTKQIGVVAQELETVFPALIDESPDRDTEGNVLETTTKSVKYSVFVPMLIKAIQEQQALITQQAEAITALTTRITALEST